MVGESERFRRDLAGVLDRWVADELVTADHAGRLRAHYRIDDLDEQAGSRFVLTILVLGSVLIGLGVISFVAANWAMIPPSVRAIGCTLLLVGCNVGGWKLWLGETHQRWGTVLLLVGAFLLGADIGLVAQWFQVGGDGGGLFLGWGLGVLAMAWGLRHAGVGAIGAGALLGATMLNWLAPWLPWVYVAAVLPLALSTRSVVLLGIGLAGVWLSLGHLTFEFGAAPFTMSLLATAVGCLGLAAFGRHEPACREALARTGSARSDHDPGYADLADRMGVLVLAFALVGWSFSSVWNESGLFARDVAPAGLASASAFCALGVAVAAAAAWRLPNARPGLLAGGAAALVLGACLALGGERNAGLSSYFALATNLALAGFALHQAWDGLARAARAPFWTGVGLLTLQVACRFMEFDTGLLLKSAAFVAWGLGLIGAGLWFEKLRAGQKAKRSVA